MAIGQSTIAVYALDGLNRTFTVPYEYLARRFVNITLLGVDRKLLILGADYRFLNGNTIETTKAWSVTDGYTSIEVRRNTSATERLVDFADGSVLRSRDLNISAIQTIHIAEEARNMAGETLAENDDGDLDARFRKIVNLKDATTPKDAVSLGQVQAWSGSALNQADRSFAEAERSQAQATLATQRAAAALASQNAAGVSETNAKTSETNSKTNEASTIAERVRVETARDVTTAARDTILAIELTANAANTSAIAARDVAISSRNAAQVSETNSKTSETNSKTSETNSKTSETNSKTNENSAIAARDRAEAAKVVIETTEITSLANANSALISKNAAGVSEANAKASELAALGYRDEASTFIPANHLTRSGNLSELTDPSAARSNLGLGASAPVGVGAVMREGAGGFLGSVPTFCLDIDDPAQRGFWYVIPATLGTKPQPSGHVFTYGNTDDAINQTFTALSGVNGDSYQPRYFRSKYGNNPWSEWAQVLDSHNTRPHLLVMAITQAPTGFGRIVPNVVKQSIGDIVHNGAGAFIIPIAGIYSISFNALGAGTGRVLLGVGADAPTNSANWGHTYSENLYSTMTINTTLYLVAGDLVSLYIVQGGLYTTPSDQFGIICIAKIA